MDYYIEGWDSSATPPERETVSFHKALWEVLPGVLAELGYTPAQPVQTGEATLVGKLAEQMRASMARAAQAERNLALMTKRAEQAERERDELRAELAHRRIIEVRNADRLERMLNSEAQP